MTCKVRVYDKWRQPKTSVGYFAVALLSRLMLLIP